MSSLVALDVAKEHLHETGTARDAEIGREVEAASDMITGYLGTFADPTWTEITLPADVRQAILILLGYLDGPGRGDGGIDPATDDDMERTWKAIASILMRRRLPSIA